MSLNKALPLLLAALAVPSVLSSFVANGLVDSGIAKDPQSQRFEVRATVRSVETACVYSEWFIRSKGPDLTDFVPCVSKQEIAERTGTPLSDVAFSKFTVAKIDVSEDGMAPRQGHVITQFHYVGDDPLASGKTQDRYDNLFLKRGDRINVRYYALERDPLLQTFFYVEHRG